MNSPFFWQPGVTLEEVERHTILAALKFFQGNRTKAAESLNIAVRTLANRLTKYKGMGIEVPPAPYGSKEIDPQ